MKITYTEVFHSLQGEGLWQGHSTVFLRLFGCNFRCTHFNRDVNEPKGNPEVQEIIKNIDKYEKFDDLPLVSTGCDSYAAIYPQFKRFNKTVETIELAKIVNDLMKEKNCKHLVITGGEPLMKGQQSKLADMFKYIDKKQIEILTFETNGTHELSDNLFDAINPIPITFSASVKLKNSGETDRLFPEVWKQLISKSEFFFFKFVVSKEEDIKEVLDIVKNVSYDYVYLMPVGGTEGPYKNNAKWVAQQCMKYNFVYSPRLQIDLWKNSWGT